MSRAENASWESLFRDGNMPTMMSLLGPCGASEWRVDVRTGFIPGAGGWPLRHRKRLARPVGQVGVIGENVFRRDLRWGRFKDGLACSELDHRPSLLLNYDVPENGRLVRQIRDHIRTTSDPHMLVGRMYYRKTFMGYFTMTRGEQDA